MCWQLRMIIERKDCMHYLLHSFVLHVYVCVKIWKLALNNNNLPKWWKREWIVKVCEIKYIEEWKWKWSDRIKVETWIGREARVKIRVRVKMWLKLSFYLSCLLGADILQRLHMCIITVLACKSLYHVMWMISSDTTT